jgi:hypothetical protein
VIIVAGLKISAEMFIVFFLALIFAVTPQSPLTFDATAFGKPNNSGGVLCIEMAVDQKAPNHSILTKFRKRLIERGFLEAFEEMLSEIIQIALECGVQFGSIQIVDNVHSAINVNTSKD